MAPPVEVVYYDDGDVSVTNRYVTVGTETYVLREVQGVRRYDHRERAWRARSNALGFAATALWVVLAVACLIAHEVCERSWSPPEWVAAGSLPASWVAGALAVATGFGTLTRYRPRTVTRVDLAGARGVLASLRFPDRKAGDAVYAAVRRAVSER